jgi:hypothetical protein
MEGCVVPLNWTDSDWEHWFTDEVESTDRWQKFYEHLRTKHSSAEVDSDELGMDFESGEIDRDVKSTADDIVSRRADGSQGGAFGPLMNFSAYAAVFSHMDQARREAFLEAWTRLVASDGRIAQAEWATPTPEDLVSLPGALGGPIDPEAEGNSATAEEIEELLKGSADSGVQASTNPEHWTDDEWQDWYNSEVEPGWDRSDVRAAGSHDSFELYDSEMDFHAMSDKYSSELITDFAEILHYYELTPETGNWGMSEAFLQMTEESRVQFYENWQANLGVQDPPVGPTVPPPSNVNRALVLAGGLGAVAVVAVLIMLFSGGEPTPEASAPNSVPPLVAAVAEAGCEDSSDCTEEEVEVIEEAIDDLECTAGSDCDLEDVEELIEVLTNCPDEMQVDDARYVDSTGDASADERQANTAATDIECTGYSSGPHTFTMIVVGDGETMAHAETTRWYNPRFIINEIEPSTRQFIDGMGFYVDVGFEPDGSSDAQVLDTSFQRIDDATAEVEWLDESTLVIIVDIPGSEITVSLIRIELGARTQDADGIETGTFGDLAIWELES